MRRVVLGFAIALVVVLQDATALGDGYVPAQTGCGAGLPRGDAGMTNTGTFRVGNASCETVYAYRLDEAGHVFQEGPLHAGNSSYYQATAPSKVCFTFLLSDAYSGTGGACFRGPESLVVDGQVGESPMPTYIFNRSVDELFKARARIDAGMKKLGRRIFPVGEKSAVLGHRG